MISANEIRNRQIKVSQVGYDKEEVNILLDEAADTVDGYVAENKELYHKLEVLANKIEEYRAEEDSIKSAQKMADQIKKESAQAAEDKKKAVDKKARETIDDANKRAENTMDRAKKALDSAKSEAQRILKQANEKAQSIIAEKTAQGNDIIENAKKRQMMRLTPQKLSLKTFLTNQERFQTTLFKNQRRRRRLTTFLFSHLRAMRKNSSAVLSLFTASNLRCSMPQISKLPMMILKKRSMI